MSALVWGNPLAWIGALAVGVPILVHLLATRRARRLAFPTLRFLPAVPPTAMRARRVEDAALLVLRCLVVLAAVAALALPWLALDGRAGRAAGDLPLAVVLDSGASMERAATGVVAFGEAGGAPSGDVAPGSGVTALDLARSMASRLTDGRTSTTVIESSDLAAGIAAARAWLTTGGGDEERAAGSGEIALLSDFQRGVLDAADLEALPASIGIRLLRIEVATQEELELPALAAGERTWSVSLLIDGDELVSSARWGAHPAPPAAAGGGGPQPTPELLAADGALADAESAARAAARVVVVPIAAAGLDVAAVTVVWPGAPRRETLLAESPPPDRPWMAAVLAALPRDVAVRARSEADRLYLFADDPPGSLASAELLAAVRRAAATPAAALDELEPGVIDDALLRGWERVAEATPAAAGNDGRWLWLAVLGLLVAEQWWRRRVAVREGSSADV